MEKTLKRLCRGLPKTQKARLARFHDDESGSMVIFTLFIIVLMLIIGGMAVDFMRFESRRAMMQGAVDSAVLAAADLDQSLTPEDVVNDYMNKSQAGNCLTNVDVDEGAVNYRSVTADCEMVMNTFFLRLIGIDQLTANAASTAIEGVGDIEVSLVLDISRSMYELTPGGEVKIEELRTAASAFVDSLLLPEFEDKISMSLVPYSFHVNVGEELFGTLGVPTTHGWSHCVDLPNGAYGSTTWSNGGAAQAQHIQTNPQFWPNEPHMPDDPGPVDSPNCPRWGYEEIIPLSQNAGQLKGAINQMLPRSGTAIYVGAKWGVTLLDPSFNANLQALPNGMIDPEFATRPDTYPDPNNPRSNDTLKYMVLMTDGKNSRNLRLADEFYDTPSERAMWNDVNVQQFMNDTATWNRWGNYTVDIHDAATSDQLLSNICTAAKNQGIVIFGIGVFEAGTDPTSEGPVALSGCASSAGHYFPTTGDDLVEIFEAIAGQITDLRLTL